MIAAQTLPEAKQIAGTECIPAVFAAGAICSGIGVAPSAIERVVSAQSDVDTRFVAIGQRVDAVCRRGAVECGRKGGIRACALAQEARGAHVAVLNNAKPCSLSIHAVRPENFRSRAIRATRTATSIISRLACSPMTTRATPGFGGSASGADGFVVSRQQIGADCTQIVPSTNELPAGRSLANDEVQSHRCSHCVHPQKRRIGRMGPRRCAPVDVETPWIW